jgi:hypothetical protein
VTDEIVRSLASFRAWGWFQDWPADGTIACYLTPNDLRLALPLPAEEAGRADDPRLGAAMLAQRDLAVAYLARHDDLVASGSGAAH